MVVVYDVYVEDLVMLNKVLGEFKIVYLCESVFVEIVGDYNYEFEIWWWCMVECFRDVFEVCQKQVEYVDLFGWIDDLEEEKVWFLVG